MEIKKNVVKAEIVNVMGDDPYLNVFADLDVTSLFSPETTEPYTIRHAVHLNVPLRAFWQLGSKESEVPLRTLENLQCLPTYVPDPELGQRCHYLKAQRPSGTAMLSLHLNPHEVAVLCDAVMRLRYAASTLGDLGLMNGLVDQLKEATTWVQDEMDDEAAKEGG